MPPFPKPNYTHPFNTQSEIQGLRNYRDTEPGRGIPAKKNNRLLVATWNIANLGQQKRTPKHYKLIAEIISWFDIVAIQEAKDDLSGLWGIQDELSNTYQVLFSDRGGNDERMAFLYDAQKVFPLEKVGEIAIPVAHQKHIKVPGINIRFKGFDRNPYLAAFAAGSLEFLLVNVHLFFGKDKWQDRHRRALEAYATARWANNRRKDKDAYVENILVLGDFNLPKEGSGNQVLAALQGKGLQKPSHSTQIASSISTDNQYDQIFFFPGSTKDSYTGKTGIFDFDGALFRSLWNSKTEKQFNAYMRYFISDHRPLWAEFRI